MVSRELSRDRHPEDEPFSGLWVRVVSSLWPPQASLHLDGVGVVTILDQVKAGLVCICIRTSIFCL